MTTKRVVLKYFNGKTKMIDRILLRTRLRLVFVKSHYSMDIGPEGSCIIRYKRLNGVSYIVGVKHITEEGAYERTT